MTTTNKKETKKETKKEKEASKNEIIKDEAYFEKQEKNK